MKRVFVLSAIVVTAGLACEDTFDCSDCGGLGKRPPQNYVELTTRSSVLNNLEVSYNRRHINKLEEVLDANFVFFLFSGDVRGDVPPQWGRQEEVEANSHLFDADFVDADPTDGIQGACARIYMDLRWEDGVSWEAHPQGNDEVWHTATVFYNCMFEIGGHYVVSRPGSKAQFTVRNAGTPEEPHWQLVEMRDLDQDLLPRSSGSTEEASWGNVKYRYR